LKPLSNAPNPDCRANGITCGFFYFRMRLKRMIKSGYNVYPTQVEAVLYKHPLVAQACVVGIPDPVTGERAKAYIVLKDNLA